MICYCYFQRPKQKALTWEFISRTQGRPPMPSSTCTWDVLWNSWRMSSIRKRLSHSHDSEVMLDEKPRWVINALLIFHLQSMNFVPGQNPDKSFRDKTHYTDCTYLVWTVIIVSSQSKFFSIICMPTLLIHGLAMARVYVAKLDVNPPKPLTKQGKTHMPCLLIICKSFGGYGVRTMMSTTWFHISKTAMTRRLKYGV